MNRILVLYRSKYGASLRYAEMLKDAVSCDVIEISRYPFDTVGRYDLIVAVGGIYASGISCMKQIRKTENLSSLPSAQAHSMKRHLKNSENTI